MAEPVIPQKAKLFIGIIFSSEEVMLKARKKLERKFGSIDTETLYIPFSHTVYYKEIGSKLYKVFFSFEKLIGRDRLADIKLYTNSIERNLSSKGNRQVNLDPGYLTLSNVFLASCKEFFHRAYLGKGVYIENEYQYVNKEYVFWDWTYPDYKKSEYLSYFHDLRKIYYSQIRDK
jgi:hypothetical protein